MGNRERPKNACSLSNCCARSTMATIQLPPDFKKFLRLLTSAEIKYPLFGEYAIVADLLLKELHAIPLLHSRGSVWSNRSYPHTWRQSRLKQAALVPGDKHVFGDMSFCVSERCWRCC